MDDIYDILVEEYGMTPQQVDELMELGVLVGEQEGIIPRQQAYAEELRSVRTPRGRSYGGVYENAHPLEFIGAGLQNVAGHVSEWKARERQEEILKEQAARRAAYLRGMRRPQTSGPPAGLPPQTTPQTPEQQALTYGSPSPINPVDFSRINPYILR